MSSAVVEVIDGAIPALEWPELIPLESPPLPSIIKAIPDNWWGDYVRASSASTETPPELAFGMALAACSTATARRLLVTSGGDHTEPTNLWLQTILASANRKSSVLNKASGPLLEWEQQQAELLKPDIARAHSEKKTAEARIKALRTAAANPKAKPIDVERYRDELVELEANPVQVPDPPRLWTSDATPETLGVMLAKYDECLAWLSSEGGLFDTLAGRYSKGVPNLDLFLKAHAGESDRVDRLSRESVSIQCARLTIGLSPQPDVLSGLVDKPGFMGRGLLARFLYLLPASNVGYRTLVRVPIHEAVSDRYRAGVHAMLDWPKATTPTGRWALELTDEALHEWRAFEAYIEQQMRPGESLSTFTSWAGKAPGAALRLAAVLHGIHHAHGRAWELRIDAATMDAALSMMTVFIKHSMAALGMMSASGHIGQARQVIGWFRRRGCDVCKQRDVQRGLQHILKSAQATRQALEVLEEHGYVQIIQLPADSAGGRPPSPLIKIRPELLGQEQ